MSQVALPLISTRLQAGVKYAQKGERFRPLFERQAKPLKRLCRLASSNTGLKPGANEKPHEAAAPSTIHFRFAPNGGPG